MRIDFLRTSSRKLRWVLGTTVACGMVVAGLLLLWTGPPKTAEEPEKDEESLQGEPAVSEPVDVQDEIDSIERERADDADPDTEHEPIESPEPDVEFETLEFPEAEADLETAEQLEEKIPALVRLEVEPKESPPRSDPEETKAVTEDSPSEPEIAKREPEQPVREETPEAESQAAEPKPSPSNPRAKEAFLKLWQRTPEFGNQLVALFANWQSGPSPYERRRGVERLKADQKAICVSSEQRWETIIKNLSVGGAELLHPEPVPRNTRLALVPANYDQTVTGRVSWVRENGAGFRIGLNFDLDPETLSESWVAETLLGLGSEFLIRRAPRRYVRVATEVHSRLVTEDGRYIEVVLCDVSLGGCLLQSEEPFQVEELTLRLGSVDCHGKVVNNRQRPDAGWSHHVTFAPMNPLETLRLLRTISSLLKKR